jgi:hypothetical protein
MDEIKNEEINELDYNNDENDVNDDDDVSFSAEENEEHFEPTVENINPDIVEEQHDHAPVEIDEGQPQQQQYEGYTDDDNECMEENNNELDEEAINSFIKQLFQLKKKNLMKKKRK